MNNLSKETETPLVGEATYIDNFAVTLFFFLRWFIIVRGLPIQLTRQVRGHVNGPFLLADRRRHGKSEEKKEIYYWLKTSIVRLKQKSRTLNNEQSGRKRGSKIRLSRYVDQERRNQGNDFSRKNDQNQTLRNDSNDGTLVITNTFLWIQ